MTDKSILPPAENGIGAKDAVSRWTLDRQPETVLATGKSALKAKSSVRVGGVYPKGIIGKLYDHETVS